MIKGFMVGQKVLVTGEWNLYKGLVGEILELGIESFLIYFKEIDRKAYIYRQDLRTIE